MPPKLLPCQQKTNVQENNRIPPRPIPGNIIISLGVVAGRSKKDAGPTYFPWWLGGAKKML